MWMTWGSRDALAAWWPQKREGESEYGIRLASLWGSQPRSHHLYPSHLVRLKYLTRDKMPGLSQTVRWPQKQHHENSAASAVDRLKMVEAGKQCSQDSFFFLYYSGHKVIQTCPKCQSTQNIDCWDDSQQLLIEPLYRHCRDTVSEEKGKMPD